MDFTLFTELVEGYTVLIQDLATNNIQYSTSLSLRRKTKLGSKSSMEFGKVAWEVFELVTLK